MAADSAVVGILRTMLTMDTASFEAGAKKSDTTLKLVENSTKRLGTEVAKLTPQAERMVKAFSGDKLLYSANNLVTAITKIGGATKLTEQEQAKANRTLSAAIEKYVAMGQVAPKAMLDLEKATRRVEQPTSVLTTKMVALGAAAGTFLSNLAFQGARTLVNFGREAFSAAGQLVDLRSKTGESLESLQRMQFVADQTGTSLDAMTNAAFMLRTRLAGGGDSVVAALDEVAKQSGMMGLTTRSSADQILTALSSIKDEQERLRLGTALFGRSFRDLAAGVTEDYDRIADGAVLSTDKQIEALSEAGDAWDKWYANRKANLRSFMGELVLLPDAIASAGVPDELGMVNETLSKATKERKAYTIETISVAKAQASYLQQLQAVQKELEKVSGSERREIEAMRTLGAETEDIVAALVKFGVNATHAESALKLLTGETKKSTTETDKAADAYGRLNSEMANLAGQKFLEHDAELMRMATVSGNILDTFTKINEAIMLPSNRVAGSDAITMAPDLGRRLQEQGKQVSEFWQRQFGSLENASLGRIGTLFLGQFGHDVTGELKASADEAELDFLRIQRSGKATADELKTAFTRWQEASDRANYDFSERFADIMGGIKQSFVGVLDEMLQYYIKSFIGGLIRGTSGANIAQGIGSLATGGATGAALGGGASFAASSVAGVEAAALGGGAGAGGSLAALATNPWTIGAAGAIAFGLLIAKKGLFRGGEEALHISPRRDKFFAQLQAMFGGTQFEAAVKASQKAKIAGNVAERMIGAVYRADDKQSYDPAQAAFMGALSAGGLKGVKGFSMGGFVPPGVVQPAILHGGQFGEDIVPRSSTNAAGATPTIHNHWNVNFHAHAPNRDGIDQLWRDEILPRFKWEVRLNQNGLMTDLEKAMRP